MIVFHIDYNLVVFGNLFCQNLFRQVVQQIPLDHPFHRPLYGKYFKDIGELSSDKPC